MVRHIITILIITFTSLQVKMSDLCPDGSVREAEQLRETREISEALKKPQSESDTEIIITFCWSFMTCDVINIHVIDVLRWM